MKTATLITLLTVLLSAGTAGAQSITIDFDESYTFGELGTYSWAPTPETSLESRSPLMHQRIVKAIENHLVRSDVREVESQPDILVTYHTSTREKLRVDTTEYDYGYPRTWHRWNHGSHYYNETTVTTYTEGTLVIDVWDADTKTLIWRGAAMGAVPRNPEKAGALIDKAVDKLGKKWDKMKRKGKVRLAR